MKTTVELPLLPLRDVVVYPHMVIPLFVGREKSIEALEAAMTGDKQILLLAQKNPAIFRSVAAVNRSSASEPIVRTKTFMRRSQGLR